MKKTTSKPAAKKPAAKKPAMKKASAKPKRKAQGQSELVEIVGRLATITEKLGETTERLATLALGPSHPGEHQGQASSEPAREEHEPPDEPTGSAEVEEFTLPKDGEPQS